MPTNSPHKTSRDSQLHKLQREMDRLDPRYKLLKIIGDGSYGIVLRAHDTQANELVAVKRVKSALFRELILARRVLREIQLLIHFRGDPNIVGLRNLLCGSDPEKSLFIVMDLMDTDLRMVLRSGQTLTELHVQFFLYQALRALALIHFAGVIHRDTTPANVLVNTTCDLKLCDFGLAKGQGQESQDQDMTDYVTMRWYRAPELVMEHCSYGGKVDLWGIGCLMAELYGSQPICQGRDRVVQLDRIVDVVGTPPDSEIASLGSSAAQNYLKRMAKRSPMNWRAKFPKASPEGIDLLQRLLTFHPSNRPSATEAMRHPFFAQWYDPSDEHFNFSPFREKDITSISELKEAICVERQKLIEQLSQQARNTSQNQETPSS